MLLVSQQVFERSSTGRVFVFVYLVVSGLMLGFAGWVAGSWCPGKIRNPSRLEDLEVSVASSRSIFEEDVEEEICPRSRPSPKQSEVGNKISENSYCGY